MGRDDEQNFIQNLSLFLCTFLKEHGQLIERNAELESSLVDVSILLEIYLSNVLRFAFWFADHDLFGVDLRG